MNNSMPIVIGVAGTQPAALRFALAEALHAGRGLQVVHAVNVPPHDITTWVGDHEFEDRKAVGQKFLDEAQAFIEQEAALPPVNYALAITSATEALEHMAASSRLLVIGVDGHWYDRMLSDGVAQHIARHAACPVVMVPEGALPSPPTGGVVVTLEGDTSAIGTLAYAFEQAQAKGLGLYILHATAPGTLPEDAEEIRADLDDVLASWGQTYPDVRVIRAFIMDGTEQAIPGASEHAELVVVGRSRSRKFSFALARPLATEVLRRAGCPVVVVPPDY